MHLGHEVRTGALAALLVAGSLLCTNAAAQNAASCDNACLKGFMDGYIDALSHRDATKLPVTKDVKYTENGREPEALPQIEHAAVLGVLHVLGHR